MNDDAFRPAGELAIADPVLEALSHPGLDPLFWRSERLGMPSAWWQHVAFAHWIVTVTRPNVLVELGTHAGVSYSAFCQAVVRAGLPTRCHAVDTWAGDEHAGAYDETVYTELCRYNEEQFGAFSTLLRGTFDDALPRIEDRSVDLLHIDGLHTYDAVRHDFDSWRGKLTDRAVVLFHDINERSGDFGVWRLWRELKAAFPSFEFLHGHGLGVLAVGPGAPQPVLALCHLSDGASIARVRTRFARLGERWLFDTRERMAAAGAAELDRLRAEAEAARAAALAEAGQAQLEREAAEAAAEAAADAAQAARNASEAAAAEAIRAANARRDAAEATARQALVDQTTAVAAAQRATTEARAERSAAQATADRAAGEAHQARLDRAAAMRDVSDLRAAVAALTSQRDAIAHSTVWRATRGLRRLGSYLPRGLRRALRGSVKLGYWAVTFQLGTKLRERQDLIRQYAQQAANPAEQPTPPGIAPPKIVSPANIPAAIVEVPKSPVAAHLTGLRVVYISGEPTTPGHRYRVQRHADLLGLLGGESTVMTAGEIQGRLGDIASATILVIWRAAWDDGIALAIATARGVGARIVFDVDDLMVDPDLATESYIDGIRSQAMASDHVREFFSRMRKTMMACDLCFATTKELAFHMEVAGKTTHVLHNGFDASTHDLSRKAARDWRANRTDDLIRIGYAGGSRTHQRDLAMAMGAVVALLQENDRLRLVLFRRAEDGVPLVDIEEYPELARLEAQIEWRLLQPLESLPLELARFDINLAPLEYGNPFCEAKSELKFFEAALVDVPTVASPTGPFRRAIAHGRTGFLAATPHDWYRHLRALASDPALRTEIAANARIAALATFGAIPRAARFGRVIDQVLGGSAGATAFALQSRLDSIEWKAPNIFGSETIFLRDDGGQSQVTVVIPLYNYEHYIVEALESVRTQSLAMLDLVIVDGYSTDRSLAVATDWAQRNAERFNRILVLQNKANYGLAFCRNSGFAAAETSYVLPLDADNRLGVRCCEHLLETIRATGAAFVYPTIERFGAHGGTMSDVPFDPHRLTSSNFVDAMALVSVEAWAAIGGYDHIRYGWEDYDFWCRLAQAGFRGAWRPEILAHYRAHASSMMTTQTMVAANYRALMSEFQRRHPWVSLIPEHRSRLSPELATVLPADAALTRLDRLLPIMRCPISRQKLTYHDNRTSLLTVDGLRVWPIVDGRAVLSADITAPAIMADGHVSNELPDNALDLIRSTQGLVLNLSAGGSREKFDHVVEVEYALFRHTDLVSDAHALPFDDAVFDAVIVMNAFEHYHTPQRVSAELLRVLKPGGRILVRTAFMQPLHEAPWHYYNCTKYGMANWFSGFEIERLSVSDNFAPNHTLAWIASEAEAGLRADVSAQSADALLAAPVSQLVEMWRDGSLRDGPLWSDFTKLTQATQEITAAGFELAGRKPLARPDLTGARPSTLNL